MDFGVGVNRLYIVLRKVREYFSLTEERHTLHLRSLNRNLCFYHNIPTMTPTSVNRDPIASPAAP